MEDIEKVFEKQLNNLWENRRFILDVKATRWHDDYNLFKQGVKDLEVMMQNVINSAFETATTVESSIELLSIFHGMAKRDAIRRAVEKRIISMFTVVLKEINLTKTEFESKKKSPELLRFHPDYSGSANWAKNLIRRVNGSWNVIKAAEFLPSLPITEEAKASYEYISTAIEEYINRCHTEWIASIPSAIMDKLDTSLMERKNGQMLEMKFDRDLIRLFHEIHYWQKLKYDIPFSVQEIYSKREELRILRDSVLLVVHDYNTILETLTPEELLLFRERIRFLDRKINPGLTNLTWSSKGITEHFVKECRKHSHDVQNIVTDFMDSSAKIQKCCDVMASQSLWLVENKKVYAIEELESFEDSHRKFIQDKLMREFETIKQTMQSNYEIFKGDGKEVYEQWVKYVVKVDEWIETALRNMIKKSLIDFSNALNGEGRSREAPSEIQPLFKVDVVLKTQRVEFSPTLPKLEELVTRLSQKIISTVSSVPRKYLHKYIIISMKIT